MTTLIIVLLVAVALLCLAVWYAWRRYLRPFLENLPLEEFPEESGPDGYARIGDQTLAFETKLARAGPVVHERQAPAVDRHRLYDDLAVSVAGEDLYRDIAPSAPVPVAAPARIDHDARALPVVAPPRQFSGCALPAGATQWNTAEDEPQEPIFAAMQAAWEPASRIEVKGRPPWQLLDARAVAPALAPLPPVPARRQPEFETRPVPMSSAYLAAPAAARDEPESAWLLSQLADLAAWSENPDAYDLEALTDSRVRLIAA